MPIEIEKKYRLTKQQRERIVRRLRELKAKSLKEEFEENTLYRGGVINLGTRALRLRKVGQRAFFTFKERLPTKSPIKHQIEHEAEVRNADALDAILNALGFEPALVYEKRRTRWNVDGVKVLIDELPFGLFMEIEASESEIVRVEKLLGASRVRAEMETYPSLTAKLGKRRGKLVEARFAKPRR